MTFWGYVLWGIVGLIALVPIVGLIAEFLEWHKEKSINDYEKEKQRGKE